MKLQNALISKLAIMENILFGYLFGSFAKNEQTDKSDVDIALYLKNTSFDARLQINYELSKLLHRDVDLIVLNDVKNMYLLESILKEGIVIKENEKRFDFELRKQHDILDFKAFKKYINAA